MLQVHKIDVIDLGRLNPKDLFGIYAFRKALLRRRNAQQMEIEY